MSLTKVPYNMVQNGVTDVANFGAVENGVTDDSTAITEAAQASDSVLVTGDSYGPNVLINNVINTRFKGEGSLIDVYRKNVIPDESPSDDFMRADLIAEKHLRQFNLNPTRKAILVGDSISTYFANTIGRSDMLANCLFPSLADQFDGELTFMDMAIGGTAYQNFLTDQYQTYIPWYSGLSGTTWIDVVNAQNPDLLVLSWQMNYSTPLSFNMTALNTVIDYINNNFNPVPSIVICTGFDPSPASTSFPEGETGQEARDQAAGALRSYVKWKNNGQIGLIDFHRKFCRVRDGFDPVSTCISRVGTTSITNTSNYVEGDYYTTDWKVRINANTAIMSNGDFFTLKTGPGSDDFVQVLKTGSTALTVALYSGQTGSSIPLYSKNITYNANTAAGFWLTVEKSSNYICMYNDTDSQYGTYNAPIFYDKCVSFGGKYLPRVNASNSSSLIGAEIYYGVERVNIPSVTDLKLYGPDAPPYIGTYGGSGFNHPGGFAATHVYRPVLDAIDWIADTAQSGLVDVTAADTTANITFPYTEPDNNYLLQTFPGENSLSPEIFWSVGTKTTTGAVLNFSSAAVNTSSIGWRILRS